MPPRKLVGGLSRRYMEDMVALAASRDPMKGVELELLFGIRKWIEYASGLILIGTILGTLMGWLALLYLSRLVP